MKYRSESFIEKVIRGISKFVLRLFVWGLLILVVAQFIILNSDFEETLIAKFPQIRQVLKLGQEEEFTQQAKMVFAPQEEYIVFQLQTNNWPRQVKLLVNDQVIGTLAKGKLKVKIKEGDSLAIDARGYEQGIWLTITQLSTPLKNLQLGQQIWVKNEYKKLGIVKLKGKF